MFEVHDPGRFEGTEIDHFGVVARIVLALVTESENGFSSVAVVSPIEVVLMAADGEGKSVFVAQHVDCAGFAVICAEDRSALLLAGRERVVAGCKPFDHFRPAESIRKILGQWAGGVLGLRIGATKA